MSQLSGHPDIPVPSFSVFSWRTSAVALRAVTSRQMAGQPVAESSGPAGSPDVLVYEDLKPGVVAGRAGVFFLALPHGVAAEYAVPLLEAGKTVFDLSADFRLKDPQTYREFYHADHPAPQLLARSVYGLPETHGTEIPGASLVACPGCYPTNAIPRTGPGFAFRLDRPLADRHQCAFRYLRRG